MQNSPLRNLHEGAGARLAHGATGLGLLTYGDVPGEYEAAQRAAVVFDATERGALLVRGAEADTFLHRITSNTVRGLEPGQGCRDLLLTSKGKVQHDFDLAREEEGFRLSTPPGDAAPLAASLDTYLFTEDVAIEDVTETHAPLEVAGPEGAERIAAVLGAEPPQEAHATRIASLDGAPVRVTRLAVAGSPGWRIDGGPALAERLWRALVEAGARPTGRAVRDILRVEACAAEWGRDIDDSIYPQEARLEDAFSLEKGCYIGQEVVAKIDTYGGLNKRLCGLSVDHDEPVPPGTRLMREDRGEWRDLGVVTTWAYSFALDTGEVLAYVKRKHQEPGTTLRLGDGPATATILEK